MNSCSLVCFKLVQGFRVKCLITGQHNTKGYGTITDDIGTIILRPDIYNKLFTLKENVNNIFLDENKNTSTNIHMHQTKVSSKT